MNCPRILVHTLCYIGRVLEAGDTSFLYGPSSSGFRTGIVKTSLGDARVNYEVPNSRLTVNIPEFVLKCEEIPEYEMRANSLFNEVSSEMIRNGWRIGFFRIEGLPKFSIHGGDRYD